MLDATATCTISSETNMAMALEDVDRVESCLA
jgi:hypothetical protein